MNTKPGKMIGQLDGEAAATAGALAYLLNTLLAKIGGPHLNLDTFNQSAQTIFLVTGGLLTSGWMYYRMKNEQLKFNNRRDDRRAGHSQTDKTADNESEQ